MTQFDKRNLSMMMDFYEMTMSYGYFHQPNRDVRVAFDLFFRSVPDKGGYAIFAGLQHVIEFVENLSFSDADIAYFRKQNLFSEEFLDFLRGFRFRGDIYAMPEGTIIYPNEPLLTIVAPIIDAQLVETAILAQINHQSLVATKASRIVRAAEGRKVADFGARRAHNMDAATYGARAAYIGGIDMTATVSAGQQFNIPISGTMAHSWVMFFEDEYTAFKQYAEIYPQATVLLVDTYDVLHSGIPNAIRIAREVLAPQGHRLAGVRVDSGDLAYLSKRIRQMLDKAGLEDCKIILSNSLDEFTISSLLLQGARVDSFGVGERLITAKSDPVFGAVYKLVAVEENGIFQPRIKMSENVEKLTNPGLKDLYRIYDRHGKAVADMIAVQGEQVDLTQPFRYVDPRKPWKNRFFEGGSAVNLRRLYVRDGERVEELPTLEEIREYVRRQLAEEIWPEEQRFENPHRHYLDMTPDYYELKMGLLEEVRGKHS
ncbi:MULTISPECIES: nicotinate phosphoribosyltransferase [Selenomonas]|uniref:nicotinate phosphoribosyltransferase n=1 Tax=Selenomonas TaxID=970 RepID=UPI0001E0AF42|nr:MULTISPECIES: nicotinate phosphoribosyltransferase [Selenomonas]EFM23770.1 nicotinate phosphoribosyltransferase [Selenomonas sp. oral taxon 149 str. 67H29BP]